MCSKLPGTLALYTVLGLVRPCTIKPFLPSFLSWHHPHEKRYQALSRFTVLEVTESWAGSGNEAKIYLQVWYINKQRNVFMLCKIIPTCIKMRQEQISNSLHIRAQEWLEQYICALVQVTIKKHHKQHSLADLDFGGSTRWIISMSSMSTTAKNNSNTTVTFM